MRLVLLLRRFSRDSSAAVTVDWVVLTAAVVVMALAVVATIKTGANDAAGTISGNIGTAVAAASTT